MILNKKLAISVLAYPLFAVACLLSYQYYNFTKTGYFHYTSITSTYLLNYQLGKTLQSEYSEAKVEEIIFNINQEAEKEKSFKDYSNKRISLTLQELNHHKIQFFKLTAIGIINFFIDPGRWDMNRYINQHNKPAYYILMLYSLLIAAFNALLFILFLYAFTLIKSNNNVLLLLILVVISIALATGITGSARFKLPVYPLLIVIALFSLQSTRLKALSSRFNLKTNLRIIL